MRRRRRVKPTYHVQSMNRQSELLRSRPLYFLCTVDGRSAGRQACAEILTSWPARRPFRRESRGTHGHDPRVPGKRHCPIAIGHRPADRRGPRRAGDAQGHSYCILTEVTRCSLKQTEPAGDLCLSHNGNDAFVKREKALNESVARTGERCSW